MLACNESPCQALQSCAAASLSVSESVNRIISRYRVVGGDGEGWYSGVVGNVLKSVELEAAMVARRCVRQPSCTGPGR